MNTSPEYLMLVNAIYPIGHIYKSTKDVSPQTFLPEGFWTWVRLENTFLYNSSDEITSSNRTGGSATAELTELPVHTHTGDIYNRTHYGQHQVVDYYQANKSPNGSDVTPADISTTEYGNGSSPTHNNMPPYRAVYMWRRTS